MAGTKTIDDLINQSREPVDTGKSMDDIMSSSDLAQFLSAALADKSNVDTRNTLVEQPVLREQRMPEIRQTRYEDISGISNEDLLGLIMGTTGGAKSLADVGKQMFKKAAKKQPHWREDKPTLDAEHPLWKFFTPKQKKDLAKLYKDDFDYDTLKKVKKAEENVEKHFYKKKIHGKSVADYMKLEEGRTSLPGPTLPELVSQLLYKYSK